ALLAGRAFGGDVDVDGDLGGRRLRWGGVRGADRLPADRPVAPASVGAGGGGGAGRDRGAGRRRVLRPDRDRQLGRAGRHALSGGDRRPPVPAAEAGLRHVGAGLAGTTGSVGVRRAVCDLGLGGGTEDAAVHGGRSGADPGAVV